MLLPRVIRESRKSGPGAFDLDTARKDMSRALTSHPVEVADAAIAALDRILAISYRRPDDSAYQRDANIAEGYNEALNEVRRAMERTS